MLICNYDFSNKIEMKLEKNLFKDYLYHTAALKEESKIDKDPIFKLLFSIREIKDVSNLPNFTKYLYLSAEKVDEVLYELQETIEVDNQLKDKDLSFYFYLLLLIMHNPDIINYVYHFNFIKEINNWKKNKNNYILNIIISKIVLILIYNFKGFDEYDEIEHHEEIVNLERENREIINSNIKYIEDINLNFIRKYIIDNNIDQIYIEIIIQLIKNDKLSNYEFSYNIISQLNFEKIDLNEYMLVKLSNVLNSNEKNVIKYIIDNYNDLLDSKIVNFHYILLKYIIKSSIYIYQISFLLKIHKNIIKIINSNSYELITIELKDQDTERLAYILEKYSDLYYYFKKFLDLKLVINEEKKYNNEFALEEKNKINNLNKEVNNYSSDSTIDKIKENEYENEIDIQNRLFNSIFLLHTNEKGKEPYIIIDKILLGKDQIEIQENYLNDINESNENENYKRFLSFWAEFKNKIKNEFLYNYCLKLKLQFATKENNIIINKNSIYNISCTYTFYNPIDKSKKTFKDDNILINNTYSLQEGFLYMIREINNELFGSLEYEFNEKSQKILSEQNNNNIISKLNIIQPQQNNNYTIINHNYIDNNNNKTDHNHNPLNNIFIKDKNNCSTKPSTDFDIFNIEAEEEEIIAPIEVINNNDNLVDFFMELSNGYFISYGKNNKLIGYDYKYNSHEIENLYECIFNISEKQSDNLNIIEIIVCCVNNIYLIYLHKSNCQFNFMKKYQISNMNYFLCYELKKDHYIVAEESSTIYCEDIFIDQNSKSKSSNYKVINIDAFRSGIKINDNMIALTSNSVIPHGQDNLSLYNIETQKTIKIFGYSYIYGTNGLSLMNIKGKQILLCACKKYFPEQKNGIVIIDLSTMNNEKISKTFFDTNNIEVNCFCPILDIKNKNMDKCAIENNEYKETEYFFVGGFDEEKGEGIIQLYKAFYNIEEYRISIEYLQDIEFKSNNIFKDEGSITCIKQSKINGNILANCSNGYIYLFSKPNIKYYLEEIETEMN